MKPHEIERLAAAVPDDALRADMERRLSDEADELACLRDALGEDYYRNRPESGPRRRLAATGKGSRRGKSRGEADYETADGRTARTRVFRTPALDVGATITYSVDAVEVDGAGEPTGVSAPAVPVTLNAYAVLGGREWERILDQAREHAVARLEKAIALDGALDDFPVLEVAVGPPREVVVVEPSEEDLDARIEARLAKRAQELELAFEARVAREAENRSNAAISDARAAMDRELRAAVAEAHADAERRVEAATKREPETG